jgi:hypothetical protein
MSLNAPRLDIVSIASVDDAKTPTTRSRLKIKYFFNQAPFCYAQQQGQPEPRGGDWLHAFVRWQDGCSE